MEFVDDLVSDALLAEALDAYELSNMPFVPTCVISSGFCPTGPTFSNLCTISTPLLSTSAASSTPPILQEPNPLTSSSLYSSRSGRPKRRRPMIIADDSDSD